MAIKIPEAQLQGYVLGLVRDALSHLPPASFAVEKWLKFRIGRTSYKQDGTKGWSANGRADLVIYYDKRPLAIFELKREDHPLTTEDVDQGRSYAKVMLDQPPLVIVSNGKQTWTRQSWDGQPVDRSNEGTDFVEKLFSNVGKLAAANLSWAIEVLMGPEAGVWVETVRQRTDELIARLTGDAADTRKPFTSDRLFRRAATAKIDDLLNQGAGLVIVEGAPLTGKSNVLRELAEQSRSSSDKAVFLVNAGTRGSGLYQRLANVLGEALEWKLSADDVRTWLRRMSRSSRKPALILAVDGLVPGSEVERDLEDLAELGLGSGLRIVVATDRADDIVKDVRGRGETALGAIANVIEVGPLADHEFQDLRKQLAADRILFYGGAELSPEYRAAWILRSVLAGSRPPAEEDRAAVIPATMGLKMIQVARRRLETMVDVARLHRVIAREVVADEAMPSPELALSQSGAYVVRRDGLTSIGEQAANSLEEQGWISFHRHLSGVDVLVFRAPEFFISEFAFAIAEALGPLVDSDLEEAVAQLIWQSQRFFLGDLVGAQVLVDLAKQRKTLPAALIEPLMNDTPTADSVAGKVIRMMTPDGRIMNFRFDDEGGVASADNQGSPIGPFEPAGAEGPGVMYGNMTSWMILSQLARLPSAIGEDDSDRLDIEIMLHVGRCGIPLVRGGTDNPIAHATESLGRTGTVLQLAQALAEPLTAAIHKLFAEEWRNLGPFLKAVVNANSLPLTMRVHHALASLCESADPELEAFVQDTLKTVVIPLIRQQLAAAAPG